MLEGEQQLHNAIYNDNYNQVIKLLESGVDVNYKAKDDVNALHIAAFKGNVAIARTLIEVGIEIDATMTNGASALFLAARFNHLDIVSLLVEKQADLNKSLYQGDSPLDAAIFNKNIPMVKLLVAKGANIYSDKLIGALEFLGMQGPINRQFILDEHFKRLEMRNALQTECDRASYKQDNEVVVVRCKEDISWIPKEFPCHKVTIYNKCQQDLAPSPYYNITNIPNLGFYDGTILKHIVDHYNNLAPKTLFVQGFPYDGYLFISMDRYFSKTNSSCNNIIGKCQFANLARETISLQQTDFSKGNYKSFNYQNNNLTAFAFHYLDTDIPESFPMIWNSQFAVDREVVYRHSCEYYQKLLATINYAQYPFEAFYFERLWDLVFAETPLGGIGESANLELL